MCKRGELEKKREIMFLCICNGEREWLESVLSFRKRYKYWVSESERKREREKQIERGSETKINFFRYDKL